MRAHAAAVRPRVRDLRRARRGAIQRGTGLPCAERVASRRRLVRRRSRQRRLVGQHGGAGQAARHRSLLRRRRQQPRQLLRIHGSAFDRSGDGRAVRQFLSADHGRGLGRRASAARRSARHRAMGRGDGRQPRGHAGARLGDPLSGAHPQRARHRRGTEPVGGEHRVQRDRAPGDHDRPRLPRREFPGARREAAPRAARRADDRAHHVPVRRADGRQVRPAVARRHPLLVRAGIPDRVVPALSGREIRRVLRREHVPAHHEGARLFRPRDARRRRPRARSRARHVQAPRDLLHHRLALPGVALARDHQGAGAQAARRLLCRDRGAARSRRVPARQSAVSRRRAGVVRPHRRRHRSATASRAPITPRSVDGSPTAHACSTWAAATARCCNSW